MASRAEPGKYKYVISTSFIDKESEDLKQNRKDAFEIREEVLDLLINEITILKNPDALTEIINNGSKKGSEDIQELLNKNLLIEIQKLKKES